MVSARSARPASRRSTSCWDRGRSRRSRRWRRCWSCSAPTERMRRGMRRDRGPAFGSAVARRAWRCPLRRPGSHRGRSLPEPDGLAVLTGLGFGLVRACGRLAQQQHEPGRHGSRPDPEQERVRRRDRERLVDRPDDGRHIRLDDRASFRRHGRQQGRAKVADPGQGVETAAASQGLPDLGRNPGRADPGGTCSARVVAKIVPVSASPTVPPTAGRT